MTRPRNSGDTIAPSYIDDLRRLVEAGPGVLAVAREAGLSRVTVWRMLSNGGDRPALVNLDAVGRIRDALLVIDPSAASFPPPVVTVQNADHHAWIGLADELSAVELAAVIQDKPRTLAALRASIAPPPKPRRKSVASRW